MTVTKINLTSWLLADAVWFVADDLEFIRRALSTDARVSAALQVESWTRHATMIDVYRGTLGVPSYLD